MGINIRVRDNKPVIRYEVLSVMGKLSLSDYHTTLYMPLDFWTIADYKQQWKEGLKRLKDHNQSCLVATIHDPEMRTFVDWWLLYKVGNDVYVQNQLIIADIYQHQIGNKSFTIDNCYDFIQPRVINEGKKEDEKVSEWMVSLNY